MSDIIKLSSIPEETSFPEIYFDIANEKHFWCRGRIDAFIRFLNFLDIPTQKPLKVLDVGCGNGLVRRQLEVSTDWIIDGADLNYYGLLKNEGLKGNTYYYNIFDLHQSFRNKYDIIILFDVLEHIEQPCSFLEALSYHVHQGGWLLINVPALEFLRSSYDQVQGHFRRYTKKKLQGEFLESSFKPCAFAYWGFSLLPLAIARKMYLRVLKDSSDVYARGFTPPSAFMNTCLSQLLRIETKLFPNVPLGTALLSAARKM